MLSNKPYLIRAYYEWITDNDCTPYIVVNADFPGCQVPLGHVENGEITFNISSSAVRELALGNEVVEFLASFSGTVNTVYVPVKAVVGIYAQENQQGMFFDYEDPEDSDYELEKSFSFPATNETVSRKEKSRGHLKLVE